MSSSPSSSSKSIAVWDLPTRIFHWTLVVCVATLAYSGEIGGLNISLPLPTGGQWVMANMDIHMLLGEIVLGLVIFRLLWGFVGSSTARFGSFVRGPKAVFAYLSALRRGELPLAVGHNPAGGLMILGLLTLAFAQVGTGLFANDDIFSEGPLAHLVSSSTSSMLTEVHGAIFSVLLIAIAAHVGAALYYRLRGENLIKAMITGHKDAEMLPAGAAAPRLAPLWLAVPAAVVAGGLVWALVTKV